VRVLALLAFATILGACAGTGGLQSKGPTVGQVLPDLPKARPPAAAPEAKQTEDAVGAYRAVEGTLPDDADNQRVERRMADLGRRLGAESGGTHGADAYRAAIARYEALLAQPDVRGREEILYHLAESYDALDDRASTKRYLDRLIAEFPDSDYRIEAHFRRAELAFSANAFDRAAADYAYVVEHGRSSVYWQNANYMLGWTHLKRADYQRSLELFFATIDAILVDDEVHGAAAQEMLDDTLRAIVLDATYLDGAKTLSQSFQQLRKPRWQYRVYERLAEELRRKQRYLDSVAAFETFVEQNPYDPHAPGFDERAIQLLTEANFPAEARKYKEAFVRRYRYDGDYWVVNGVDGRADVASVYKAYLMEVAKLAHRDGQQRHEKEAYLAAAAYYHQFSETFPDDAAAGEALFLEGEALTEAGQPPHALIAYQRVIHEHPNDAHADEAGYAAILALGALLQTESARTAMLRRTRIDAQIEFAALFPNDARAAEAQVDAANTLFEMHEYDEAAELAEALLRRDSKVPSRITRTAALIAAHSAFEQARFDIAEARYRQGLRIGGSADDDAAIRVKLQAAIYKQAEADEQRGDVDGAVHNYLRIAGDGPDSELAAKGHFDAVAAYEAAERWSEAADLLQAFRTRYPHDALTADQTPRLAGLYEKAGRKHQAADEYRRMAIAGRDTDAGREALYHAAELYLDDDSAAAIDSFRSYVNTYPAPPDLAMEAAHHLDGLYARSGDAQNRDEWLHKQIEIASRVVTDRGRYLAANAQFELAGEARRAFDSVTLSGDLAKSLARKQKALKETVTAFERVAGYGVAEFATASTYQIADTYAALARELIASAVPADLSELERQQYVVLLEEQAAPFEDLAISIHEVNTTRSWQGIYDAWVQKSFDALRVLVPARYDRPDPQISFVDTIQ
jgi:TolA-binding protein